MTVWNNKIWKHTKFVLWSFSIALLLLIGIDLSLHQYLKGKGGYNYRGYRGDIQFFDSKIKIACFGGSTTFGFGVPYDQTWPYYLGKKLKEHDVSIYNLGIHGQGIFGIRNDLDYFDYLDYDIAIIYNGYNDLHPDSLQRYSFRKNDFLFDNFNYKSIIQDYFNEQLLIKEQKIDQDKVAFNKDQKNVKEYVINYMAEKNTRAIKMVESGMMPYNDYLDKLNEVFTILLQKNKKVYFVCPPDLHTTIQQQKVKELIRHHFSEKIQYIQLNEQVSLRNDSLCYDGMHLTKFGNQIVASQLQPWVANAVDTIE